MQILEIWKKRKEKFLKIVNQSKADVFLLFDRFQNNQLTVVLKYNFSQKGNFQSTFLLLVVLLDVSCVVVFEVDGTSLFQSTALPLIELIH